MMPLVSREQTCRRLKGVAMTDEPRIDDLTADQIGELLTHDGGQMGTFANRVQRVSGDF